MTTTTTTVTREYDADGRLVKEVTVVTEGSSRASWTEPLPAVNAEGLARQLAWNA